MFVDSQKIEKYIMGIENQYIKPINELINHCNPFKQNSYLTTKANELYFSNGSYCGIKKVFYQYILQKKMLGIDFGGNSINIMTMHKSKGKEFDGVILFDGLHGNSLELKDDDDNLSKTRALVRVAMTRARHCVSIIYQDGNKHYIFS